MRTLFALLAVLVVVGVIPAFYQGWFRLSSERGPGQSNVTLSVDKDKIEADKNSVLDKTQNLGHQAVDQIPGTNRNPRE